MYYGVVEGYPILNPIQKISLRNRVVVPSRFCKEILEEYGINVRSIIPHGIDHKEFRVNPREIQMWREQFKEKTILYYLGNATSRKGIPALIASLKYVKEKLGSTFICVIDTEDYGKQKFQEVANNYNVEDVILINGLIGKQAKHDIALKLNACDLYVHPSYAEGFGLPILEAMACKKAPLAINAPPMNELVSPKEGWLVPYFRIEWEKYQDTMYFKKHMFSSKDFAEKIIIALENPDESLEKGVRAYEKSLKYDYKKTYAKFLELL